jgi:histidine triad (HIT) family protein
MSDCLFCGIVAGDVPAEVVHETPDTVAFRDINPVADTHVLIVPRRHIENAATVTDADGDVLAALVTSAKAVADAAGISGADRGYRLVFNVGRDATNSVPHLHLHVIGGRPMTWPPG